MRLAWIVLAGCHATTSLDPPQPAAGARSMILMASAEDFRAAYAIDVPADGTLDLPTFNRPAEIDLFAASYACPLDVLGMEPGRQHLDEPALRVELPAPIEVIASHDGADQTAWSTVEMNETADILRAIRLPDQNLCRLYGVALGPLDVSFAVTETSTPTGLVALRNGNVLVAHADRTFYEVTPDRIGTHHPALDGAPNDGGFVRNDGTIVLVERDGTIAHGSIESGYTILQTATGTVQELILVDGSRTGAIEVFRVSFGGPFERWSAATGWVMLTDGGARFDFGSYSLAAIGTNEAIAVGVVDGINSAFRYKDGNLIEERIPGAHIPTGIANIPGAGLVVGTDKGAILRYLDGEFVLDSDTVIDSSARTIVPTDRGFFYGRYRWASWDPIGGYCAQEPMTSSGTRVAPLGDRKFLVIGDLSLDRLGEQSFLFTLDRNDFEHPCLGK